MTQSRASPEFLMIIANDSVHLLLRKGQHGAFELRVVRSDDLVKYRHHLLGSHGSTKHDISSCKRVNSQVLNIITGETAVPHELKAVFRGGH